MHILALNTGSSSLKYGLYDVEGDTVEALFSDQTDAPGGNADPVHAITATLKEKGLPRPDAIGHRIVHGGPNIRDHALIDDALMLHLEEAKAYAPLHVPAAVDMVRRAREAFPDAPQVACFDTAFHKTMPAVARTLPLPADLRAGGIERYGFHGLSYESIVRQLGEGIPQRVVIAHLGNGASLCAVRDGKSIDTTMGLTPTGGIVMGTRPGDLDPGVLLYLMREKGYDAERLEKLVDRESGLRGLSGGTSDMRQLHAANDDASRLALDVFVHVARKHIAAMVASLGGMDLLVFTGGIGENDAKTRDAILAGLQWMGDFNSRVIPTEEDAQIARHTANLATQT
ncbi:acetate/propionate family kinase [Luteibacter aegosomatissinici]|uniref:acetate/propionate family kinase n=1 Tax=Luteibacter aegosomatissinici TaxID=2911539 RepID=UPI001FFA0013|nr:acetate kinase [Luteibacter aegosomatissinici]UPG92895.1 acetate kinase [Luteibacter aegosomatissinici]